MCDETTAAQSEIVDRFHRFYYDAANPHFEVDQMRETSYLTFNPGGFLKRIR